MVLILIITTGTLCIEVNMEDCSDNVASANSTRREIPTDPILSTEGSTNDDNDKTSSWLTVDKIGTVGGSQEKDDDRMSQTSSHGSSNIIRSGA